MNYYLYTIAARFFFYTPGPQIFSRILGDGSPILDDWVLCRIRQKGNNSKNISEVDENPKNKLMDGQFATITQELPSAYMTTNINYDIMSRFRDFQLMASILVSQDLPTMVETCSPELLQVDNNGQVYDDGDVTFGGFDEAPNHGWIM
ncbi:hypothetical protein Hanom_Chr02g00171421 [Helianthus anomalus]